jgi:microsomal dipeptidase-like Zn-dependent dipeptidase
LSGLFSVPDTLFRLGYKPADVEQIAHGNWIRFLQEAWA